MAIKVDVDFQNPKVVSLIVLGGDDDMLGVGGVDSKVFFKQKNPTSGEQICD